MLIETEPKRCPKKKAKFASHSLSWLDAKRHSGCKRSHFHET